VNAPEYELSWMGTKDHCSMFGRHMA
jgi:hypothetical protein